MTRCVFDNGDECGALNVRSCEGCAFRKSRKAFDAGRKKARGRLNSLPIEQVIHIRRKYYRRNGSEA